MAENITLQDLVNVLEAQAKNMPRPKSKEKQLKAEITKLKKQNTTLGTQLKKLKAKLELYEPKKTSKKGKNIIL